MIVPDHRPDIPILVVRPGETVRFHLAFTPSSVELYVGHASAGVLHRRATRAVEWRASGGRGDRLVTLDVHAPAAGGSASYLARVQVR